VNANEVRRESARGLRPPAGHGFVDAHHVVAHARWRWRWSQSAVCSPTATPARTRRSALLFLRS